MSEDLEQLKRDYKAVSTPGNAPGVRDLYPYIVSQKGLTEKDIPERKYLLGDWLPVDSFGGSREARLLRGAAQAPPSAPRSAPRTGQRPLAREARSPG